MKQQLAKLLLSVAFGAVLCFFAGEQFCQAEEPKLNWYRGNLHTHSLWSDGNDFPEMICDWYKSNGYHFLALSDHNILSDGEKWIDVEKLKNKDFPEVLQRYQARFPDGVKLREKDGKQQVQLQPLQGFRKLFDEDGKFLLIQGEEITDHHGSLPIHINATNLQELIRPQGGKSVRDTISKNLIAIAQQSKRIGQPILAHLNHPNYGYGVTAEDLAHVLEEQFFEVYNGHPGVNHLGDEQHAGTERMWDVANTIRLSELGSPPLLGIATDDSHNYKGNRGASPGRGWVMVRSKNLAAHQLIHAMEDGQFYASSGVELAAMSFDKASGTFRAEAKAVLGERLTWEFVGTLKNYDHTSRPVVDKDGKEIAATRTYSADVGKVLKKVEGTTAEYKLTGEELYVRAVVTSSLEPKNPAFKDQRQQAWLQPFGWEENVKKK